MNIEKLKSKAALFWLDGVLPFMPILAIVVCGLIGSATGATGVLAWLAIIIPISFTGIWSVWHYGIRSKLNIPEKPPLFWRVFGQFM